MQFIVQDKSDFETLKSFASYCSPLTGVIEIPDTNMNIVFETYKNIISKYVNQETKIEAIKPTVILSTKDEPKLYVENCDDLTRFYLDLTYDGEVKRDSFVKLLDMLKLNLLNPSKEVIDLLSKDLTQEDSIDKLFSSRFTTNYKHKRYSLKQAGTTIADLKLFDESRELSISQFKVYLNLEIVSLDGTILKCKDDYGNNYELRFFYLPENRKAMLCPGIRIGAMAEKVYGRSPNKILIDPEIVPLNFPKTFLRPEIKTNKRDIPIKLLRVAFAEYSYRMLEL